MQKITLPLLFLSLFLLLLDVQGQKQKWNWQNPTPQGNHIRGSHALDPRTVVMVGDAGTIIKTKDGGKTWDRQESGTKEDLYSVHFLAGDYGVISGVNGMLLVTTDCGKTWRKLDSGRKDTLRGISILTRKSIIAVGDTGTIIRSNDGGKNWVYTPIPNFKSNLNDVIFPAPDFGIIVGDAFAPFGGPPIVFTSDSGITFSPWGGGNAALTNININSVWMPEKDPTKAVLVGDQGLIISTTTQGQSFSKAITSVTVDISDVWFFNDQNGFATGPNGTLLRTKDCGDTWSLITIPSPLNRDILTLIFPDSANGYFGGSNGLLFGTNDQGSTFNQFQTAYFPSLTDITFLDDSFGIAVGRRGIFLRTENGGNDWIPPSAFDFFTLNDLECVTTTTNEDPRTGIWAAGGDFGDSTRIFFSDDKGLTWDPQVALSPDKLFSVTFRDSLNGTAVGLNGLIFCTRNGGKTWTKKNGNTNNWLLDVTMPNDSTAYAVGGFGTIIKGTNFGNTWKPLSSGTQEWLTTITFLDDTFGMTAGNHGVILRTKNAGDTWEDVSNPRVTDIDYTSLSLFRRRLSANKNGESDIGATVVGFDGTIYFSPDFGDTWIEQDSKTKFPLQACYFLDSLKGWAVGDFGTILHTNGHFPPTVSIDDELERPAIAHMGLCYPNPAHTSTTIPFQLKQTAVVHLELFDWSGKLIKTLVSEKMPAGEYEQEVDVEGLSEGFYLYRMRVGEELFIKRMIVLD